jgi:hypothetical protein
VAAVLRPQAGWAVVRPAVTHCSAVNVLLRLRSAP